MISNKRQLDEPTISILMAIYEPRMDWLKEQLISINNQTYSNIRLYIRDDNSKKIPYIQIQQLVKDCITAFPYVIQRNELNLGSNRTFELLTQEAEGDYFAYCDQDDIWLPEKLSILEKNMQNSKTVLVCSDMIIIDSTGKIIADSITKIRRRHIFRSGADLADTLWYSNFSSGCAMLVQASIAKAASPYNPYMYYDHYITLYSANIGEIVSLSQPLLLHREHDNNQSSTLQGIYSKASYRKIRIEEKAQQVFWLNKYFICDQKLKRILEDGSTWMKARLDYARGDRSQWKKIWKYRSFGPLSAALEISLPYIPEKVFQILLYMIKKNYI